MFFRLEGKILHLAYQIFARWEKKNNKKQKQQQQKNNNNFPLKS